MSNIILKTFHLFQGQLVGASAVSLANAAPWASAVLIDAPLKLGQAVGKIKFQLSQKFLREGMFQHISDHFMQKRTIDFFKSFLKNFKSLESSLSATFFILPIMLIDAHAHKPYINNITPQLNRNLILPLN